VVVRGAKRREQAGGGRPAEGGEGTYLAPPRIVIVTPEQKKENPLLLNYLYVGI
jgi:hypothetical protein